MLHFCLHFLPDMLKLELLTNFCKLVRQYTEGVVGSIIWILLEIYFSFK